MAHNFKRPRSIDPKERREDKQIALMASVLQQESLDALLAGSPPEMRAAMLARLMPHLGFIPVETIADCPHCGLQRGAAVQHECVTTEELEACSTQVRERYKFDGAAGEYWMDAEAEQRFNEMQAEIARRAACVATPMVVLA